MGSSNISGKLGLRYHSSKDRSESKTWKKARNFKKRKKQLFKNC